MKQYTTVIFDLDGTLLDTLADLADGVNIALRLHGFPEHTTQEVCMAVGRPSPPTAEEDTSTTSSMTWPPMESR